MGQFNHDTCISHFSHPHPLELSNSQSLCITSCSACNLQPSGWMYSCKPCNFTLHMSCTQMPTLITHPSHPIHPLTLFSTHVYPGGSFNCDGCGSQGNGFSYRCTTCDFDIHMMCATNPLSLAHRSHPHQLNLAFYPPYQTNGFSCDICHKIGSKHWLYRCGACEFDAHLECAMGVNVPPLPHLQHSNSLPVANNIVNIQYQQQQQPGPGGVNAFRHSRSMDSIMPMQQQQSMQQQQHASYQQQSMQQQQHASYQQQSMQQQQHASYQQPNEGPSGEGNGTVIDAVVQGFVEGAAQQVGQMLVQSIINPDDNGDSTDNNGSDSNGGGNNSETYGVYFDVSEHILSLI